MTSLPYVCRCIDGSHAQHHSEFAVSQILNADMLITCVVEALLRGGDPVPWTCHAAVSPESRTPLTSLSRGHPSFPGLCSLPHVLCARIFRQWLAAPPNGFELNSLSFRLCLLRIFWHANLYKTSTSPVQASIPKHLVVAHEGQLNHLSSQGL
jgi:hypothetical protein